MTKKNMRNPDLLDLLVHRGRMFRSFNLFGRPDRLLLVVDTAFATLEAKLGSVRSTTGAAKVGGYYVDDRGGSSPELKESPCFSRNANSVRKMR